MKQLNWYQIFGNTHTIPDGRTVTPTDDIQTLLHCANIWDKSYTTLAEVLADDDTLFLICISDNAIDYLVRSTTWASYNDIVPKMTSNTSPSGICFGYNTYSGLQPYYSFDQNYDDNWASRIDAYGYVGYIFDTPQVLGAISMDSYYLYKCVIEGSNDTTTGFDGTWEQIGDEIAVTTYGDDSQIHSDISVFNGKAYKAYRLYITSGKGGSSSRGAIRILQFHTPSIVNNATAMQYIGASDYASETLLSDSAWLSAIDGSAYKDYVINASVPTMTDYTSPSGEVIYTSTASDPAWRAFNRVTTSGRYVNARAEGYIGYVFPIATKVFLAELHNHPNYYHSEIKIQTSSDGVNWDDVTDYVSFPADALVDIPCTPTTANRYWRAYGKNPQANYIYMYWMNFYGRQNAGVQSWLKAGGVNKKYTTVSEVLSDLTTLATLMSSSDAIDYLVTAKGWATEICSDSNAMADIGMNNYAANTLLADETWREAICNSTYKLSVLNVTNPNMTDNTHPYGECFASSTYSDSRWAEWKAFTGSVDTYGWNCNASEYNTTNQAYIGYAFPTAVKVCMVEFVYNNNSTAVSSSEVRVVANDNSVDAWNVMSDVYTGTGTGQTERKIILNLYAPYKRIALKGSFVQGGTRYFATAKAVIYGRKDI